MVKNILKKLLFSGSDAQTIRFGPAKGMQIKYDVTHRSQHLLGLYEREIYPFLEKGMSKAETLIDVGANDGYYLLAFLKTGKQVIACEPGPIVTELVANAALNGYTEEQDYKVETRLVGNPMKQGFVGVEELTSGSRPPYFLLVDIDGGEADLLRSCGDNFAYHNATWLIETHSKELEDECIALLKAKNYKVKIIRNKWWRFFIKEQRPLEHNRWLYAETK
ncbi:hypothetical protein [Sediminibacterium ginsengisoli]|uniref:Methyltransferase, FkbM family n=1 Tax=Sediminibacterium ginsengisoli TaxID=413434 RepID=A0A1T4Q5K0_9BACT|nr:hypothetical protein [Sediminibacterium ginsengisoli]SJZ98944.1 hypothetical protein SAMN04488132_107154 [Sediminibacterium ginsengisoli]